MHNNCPCFDSNGNFLGWYSRSVAVACFVFARDKRGITYVLASQRGEGTPDPEFVGKWNCICGYLDFNETVPNAGFREIREETGANLNGCNFLPIKIQSNPAEDKRQNVVVQMATFLPECIDFYENQFSHKFNEENEVGEIKFIPVADVHKYKWAFNHDYLLGRALHTYQNMQALLNSLDISDAQILTNYINGLLG